MRLMLYFLIVFSIFSSQAQNVSQNFFFVKGSFNPYSLNINNTVLGVNKNLGLDQYIYDFDYVNYLRSAQQVQLKVGYTLKETFSISAGISQFNYNTEEYFDHMSDGWIWGWTVNDAANTKKQKLYQNIGLDFSFSHHVIRFKKSAIYYIAGTQIMYRYAIESNNSQYYVDGTVINSSEEDHSFRKKPNIWLHAGIGYNYSLSQHFSLAITSTVNIGRVLLYANSTGAVQQYSNLVYNMYLPIGVQYQF
ncbi:MAG: hypothetical protein R3279_05800 [Putridiphycobacter sp.]|nr:hypothetical protein [Putridiphycobacter sp.]